MIRKDIESAINEILNDQGLYEENSKVQEILLQEMDSLQFIQMIVAIESKFSIGIPDEFLLPRYFDNLQNIADLVCSIINSR